MMKQLLCCLLLVLGLTGAAHAQQDNLSRDPGYVDLQAIDGWFPREAKIEVNIKGALLELVAEASRYEDPELANLLRKLKAIQVRGYEVSLNDFRSVEDRMSTLARSLESQGWDTVVKVREDDERVNMYTRIQNGVIAGMMVMVLSEDDESYFVNIVGEISPEQIGRIGNRFDIDPLRGTVDGY